AGYLLRPVACMVRAPFPDPYFEPAPLRCQNKKRGVLPYLMAEKHEPANPPLSFHNADFMNSPAARPLRILSEYLEPAERLRRAQVRDTIVFFGSARSVSPEEAQSEAAKRLARYYQDAVELARRMTL